MRQRRPPESCPQIAPELSAPGSIAPILVVVDEIARRLRAGNGVLARNEHRDVAGSLDRLVRTGALVALLPGVYCPPELQHDPGVLAHAAVAWAGPDGVLTGLTAARHTFWPAAPAGPVTVALPTTTKRSRHGVLVERRRVPPELVLRRPGFAATAPWATAVDLASGAHGGPAIDEVLRTGSGTLEQMWEAHRAQPARAGNPARAALLHDSRDLPWSEAERRGHRLLRAAGIRGWQTNQLVAGYHVDVLFRRERLVLEIDGWATHGARQAFEKDRFRRNLLVLAGHRVLNFTAWQLEDQPEWVVECVRTAVGC